jgi:hypothetical protein
MAKFDIDQLGAIYVAKKYFKRQFVCVSQRIVLEICLFIMIDFKNDIFR